MDAVQVREFMECQAENYNGDTYHLIVKNCNHFCKDICYKLTGKSIPTWEERIDRDNRIGRLISDVVGTLPKLPPSAFDKLVNDSLQGLTLLRFLTIYTRQQKQNRGRMNGYTISQGNAHSSQLVLSSRESSTRQAKYVPSGHQREMEKGLEFSSSASNSEMLHSMLYAAPPKQRLQ
ncbi:hypothetical protein RIF29_16374 [Crotalaria pallida]|uniref:PPPDE domain-containing protein n=1 Tax=Crotalaria pallida TaxID=3830 RepID=A0AAN9FF41_CROPI